MVSLTNAIRNLITGCPGASVITLPERYTCFVQLTSATTRHSAEIIATKRVAWFGATDRPFWIGTLRPYGKDITYIKNWVTYFVYLLHKDPKPERFYILPKIHKVNNPGRPIVSSNNHPTEGISQFVDFHLKPLICTIPSYVKDTTDFLNKLTAIDNLPDNALLVSLDVTSLYTNTPHNEGIDACRFFLQKRTNKHIPTETICDLIRIILTMNNFTFNSKHYLQKHGTAMGTGMAPSYP